MLAMPARDSKLVETASVGNLEDRGVDNSVHNVDGESVCNQMK